MLWNASGCIFYLGCQWLTTILVVRFSSSFENSGTLAFAMATGIIFASISLYKIRTFQVSDITHEYSGQNYIAFRIVTILAAYFFCIAYLFLISQNSNYLVSSMLYLLFKSDETFSDVLYGIEQCNDRMDYIGKSQFIRGIASLVGFALPLAATSDLNAAILGMTGACILVTLVYDLPRAKLFGKIRPRISKEQAIHLAKACLLAMIASLCANSIVSVVRQYFGIVNGEELLGIYASVATPAVLIQVAASYLYSPLIGSLASTKYKSGHQAFLSSFTKIFGILVLAIMILVVVLSLLGGFILQLAFGETIKPYVFLFPFVLIATGCVGILFYVNDVLIIIRKTSMMLACNVIALCGALSSSIPLIGLYGMNGINFAIIIGSLLGALLGILSVRRSETNKSNGKHTHINIKIRP